MTGAGHPPRIFSIPPGVPFLPALADALLSGRLVADFVVGDDDPLALASATIYLPTRRAVRALRSVFVDRMGGRSAILPSIKALGEFADDDFLFGDALPEALNMAPPIASLDRILMLAPLVQRWKARLPAHLAARYEESVVVPASAADAVWLARDLAALIDEMETEGADWTRLAGLVEGDLAGWWQVTLEFLQIVSQHWPERLRELDRTNPAAHRNALLHAEAVRLASHPPTGPVIAAGSTGSIPATAALLARIATLPRGAVVLPGLDTVMDEASWAEIGQSSAPVICGHPQYGMSKLLGAIGTRRDDVIELGMLDEALSRRRHLVSEAMRPAETTDQWSVVRHSGDIDTEALANVSLIEAANERDEALAIAVALRSAVEDGSIAALATPDRELARRVSAELLRFGVTADDSGGVPLARTPAAILLRLMLEVAFRPGDPVTLLSLLKHPLLAIGTERSRVRSAAETIDLVMLRGGTGRPDIATLRDMLQQRVSKLKTDAHPPFWIDRHGSEKIAEAREVLDALADAVAPLVAWRGREHAALSEIARASVEALENLGRSADGAASELYRGPSGEKLAAFLSGLVGTTTGLEFAAGDWPDMLAALIATETVKPFPGADDRIAIWGALEARLQTIDTLIVGGLNEGTWPRQPEADRFMSRFMKSGVDLEPPERRIGLAAHDFLMAMGARSVVLARSARSGDAPATPSRWLQRLLTCASANAVGGMRARGALFLDWARSLDEGEDIPFAKRPSPVPPLAARPRRFSVTEIETLRRDPYAIYARRILRLRPLDPILRDPGALERGTLFHDALHRFTRSVDPLDPDARDRFLAIGRTLFEEAGLPPDVSAVWLPRFAAMATHLIAWERERAASTMTRHTEVSADKTDIGLSGVQLSGRADRIDILDDGKAVILDYKTGSSPSKGQAHTLLAPQLALEAALLKLGAFADIGRCEASDLAYVRLKGSGAIVPESILRHKGSEKTAPELADEAWRRLGELIAYYEDAEKGYLSRALPLRDGDMAGDYDHLARVLEWSAGAESGGAEE